MKAEVKPIRSHPPSLASRPARLVTLTGPGGTGKTRLAQEAGARLSERFGATVTYVPLVGLTDPELIDEQIRDALGVPRAPGVPPIEQIVAALSAGSSGTAGSRSDAEGRVLLLDNFEHLLPEGAAIVQTLLERVERLSLWVTSRQSLGLPGEQEMPVDPLPVPGIGRGSEPWTHGDETHAGFPPSRPYPSPADLLQCASVALFVDRAQAVRPDFQLTASNALTVTRLCACLEGLPLSIELAAARIGVLTASQMLTRLAPPGAPAEGERFGLLATRRRVADWRHQSLRATMDWSYRLLAPELQRFFPRLSVFRRGWSLEAAEAVCGDLGAAGAAESSQYATLDYLEQLRDSSLVIAEERPPGMRYRLLETLREYGRERLREAGEAEATSERHACYFLSLVEQAEPELMGLGQAEWLARLDEEQDNLRAALAWCQAVPGHREIGLRMVGALFWFWWIRCYHREGRRWSESILARTGGAPGIPAAEACHSAALRTLARARACLTAGGMIWADGSAAHARPLMEEGVAIARECGEPGPLAHALRFLGWVVLDQQDFIAARSIMEESLHLHRRMENQIHIGRSLNFLATLARVQGDYSEAERLWEEVSEVSRQAGDQWAVALSLAGRAKVRLLHGDRDPARALYEQALKLRREIGDVRGIAECLEGLAEMACADGEMERTARLLGAADAVREAVGHAVIPTDWPIARERAIAAARGHLGDGAFAGAWAQGRALSVEQAVAEALRKPEG